MSPIVLDPREARPLTSREISKVLAGIIGGVVATNPRARPHVAGVVDAVIRSDSMAIVNRLALGGIHNAGALDICPTWACAFSATVAGLTGWCDPKDIRTALHWVAENLNLICPPDGSALPRN